MAAPPSFHSLPRENSLTKRQRDAPAVVVDDARPPSPFAPSHSPMGEARTARFGPPPFVPVLKLPKPDGPAGGSARAAHGAHGSPCPVKGHSPRVQDGGSGRTTTDGSDSQSASARSTSSLPTSARSQPNSARSASASARAPSSNELRQPNSARRPEEVFKQQGLIAIRKMHELQHEAEMWKAKAIRLQRLLEDTTDSRVGKLEQENKLLKEKLRKTAENVDSMKLKERVMTQRMGDVEERNKDLQNRLGREERLVKEMRKREKKAKKTREEELLRENIELQRVAVLEGSACKSPRGVYPADRKAVALHVPATPMVSRKEEELEKKIHELQRQLDRAREESRRAGRVAAGVTKLRRVSFGEHEKPVVPSPGPTTPRPASAAATLQRAARPTAAEPKAEEESPDEDTVLSELNTLKDGITRLMAVSRRRPHSGRVTFAHQDTSAASLAYGHDQ